MKLDEYPQMLNCSYSGTGVYTTTGGIGWSPDYAHQVSYPEAGNYQLLNLGAVAGPVKSILPDHVKEKLNKIKPKETEMADDFSFRMVKVFIVDTDKNLKLADRLIFQDERVTDLNDQELFFEYGVKELLDKHNKLRAETVDKKKSEKSEKPVYLEPIRIKDLKMVVVDLFRC